MRLNANGLCLRSLGDSINSSKFIICFLLGLAFSLQVAAAQDKSTPTVTEHFVNGYRVVLINQHQGNAVEVGVHVATGSLHDDPKDQAGLAHFWEHVIHRGTEKYPNGRAELESIAKRLGGFRNASTSSDHTYFHMYGHPEALHDILGYLGAQMSKPSWNQSYLEAEKKVVMNEAHQIQDEDIRALDNGMMMALIPHHPFAMFQIGSQEQLQALDMGDIQDLFFANYQPKNVTVLVAGNFDTVVNSVQPLKANQILDLVGVNFIPPKDFRASPKRPDLFVDNSVKVFPPFIESEKQARIVEIGTHNHEKIMVLKFEVPNSVANEKEAEELLCDYLSTNLPGSLAHLLIANGLVHNMGAEITRMNNLNIVSIVFSLTEEGGARRHEIPIHFFSALRHIQEVGIPTEILSYFQQKHIKLNQKEIASPIGSVAFLSQNLTRFTNLQENFNFDTHFESVTNEKIKSVVAPTFNPHKMLFGYIGSDVESDQRLPVFDRPVKIINDEAQLQQWNEAFVSGEALEITPRLMPVQIRFSRAPLNRANKGLTEIKDLSEGNHGYIEEFHNSSLGAVSLELKNPRASADIVAARNLIARMFIDNHLGEGSYLAGLELPITLTGNEEGWAFTAEGNSQASLDALNWLFNGLKDFNFTERDLARTKRFLSQSYEGSKNDFAAAHAMQASRLLVNTGRIDRELVTKRALELTSSEIKTILLQDFKQADITVVLAGDYSVQNVKELIAHAETAVPSRLTAPQRSELAKTTAPFTSNAKYWKQLPETKSDEDIGVARVYGGTKPLSKEHSALMVVSRALNSEIFLLNRSTKGLGYVHGAYSGSNDKGAYLTIYGETGDANRWNEISEGWNEIVKRVQNRTLSPNQFKDEILGALREEQLVASTMGDELERILTRLKAHGGDLNGLNLLIKQLQELDSESIYAAAEKILLKSPNVEVTMTRKPMSCSAHATFPIR